MTHSHVLAHMTHWPIVLSSRHPSVWKLTLRRGEGTREGMGKGGMKREVRGRREKGKGRRHILFNPTSTTSALSCYFDLRNGLTHTRHLHGFSCCGLSRMHVHSRLTKRLVAHTSEWFPLQMHRQGDRHLTIGRLPINYINLTFLLLIPKTVSIIQIFYCIM